MYRLSVRSEGKSEFDHQERDYKTKPKLKN